MIDARVNGIVYYGAVRTQTLFFREGLTALRAAGGL
jgi:hypothetical protein